MAERYVRPTVGGWLRPTLIAPWISVYAAVTAAAALGIDRGLFGKVVGWALGMMIGSAWTFVFCVMLILVDVALLGVKIRTLPNGKRAWLTSLLSPFAVFGLYTVAPPYQFIKYGPWAVVAAVLVPMFAVALVARLFAGQKPLR